MVQDIEFSEKEAGRFTERSSRRKPVTPSLAECWRWIKGLLYDFINLKKQQDKKDRLVAKANKTID